MQDEDIEFLKKFKTPLKMNIKRWSSDVQSFVVAMKKFAENFQHISKKDLAVIGEDLHKKMSLETEEIKELAFLSQKYPILKITQFDPNSKEDVQILNDYFEMVNTKNPELTEVA